MPISILRRLFLSLLTTALFSSFIAQEAMATQKRRHYNRAGRKGMGGNHQVSSQASARIQDRKGPRQVRPAQPAVDPIDAVRNHQSDEAIALQVTFLLAQFAVAPIPTP